MKATKKPAAHAVTELSTAIAEQAAANDANAAPAAMGSCPYPAHRVTKIFPRATPQQINELSQDIAKNGLLVPILVVRGEIIDGLARLDACHKAGVTPKFEHQDRLSQQDILDLSIALNLQRRHLSESQRALVAAEIANYQVGSNQHTGGVSQGQAAKVMGVSVDTLQRAKTVLDKGAPELVAAVQGGLVDVTNAKTLAELPKPAQAAVLKHADKKLIVQTAKQINLERKAAAREERIRKNVLLAQKSAPLAAAGPQFDVILADPPWDYLGPTGTPYPTMKLEDILAMPVKQRATENSVLFLWVPASLIEQGMQVMQAWGYKFKTSGVWKKGASGIGSLLRVNHELVFIGHRGHPPAVAEAPASCFDAPRGKHSEKPQIIFDMIQKMYPELTKLELFCRGKTRAGWAGWGNECEGGIDMPMTVETPVAANEPTFADAGDELLSVMGLADSTANRKRA